MNRGYILAGIWSFGIAFSHAQTMNSFLLSQARSLVEKGDYLYAARMFNAVAESSSDSSEIADALYGVVICGDRVAQVFSIRKRTLLGFDPNGTSTVQTELTRAVESDVDSLSDQGIYLKFGGPDGYDCWNENTSIRELLSTKFSTTAAGELAAYDLVPRDTSGDPRVVIKRGNAFLRRYPKSAFKYDIFHILGRAWQDLWEISSWHDEGRLTEAEKGHPEKFREQAIRNLTLARSNQGKLVKLKWDSASEKVLKELSRKGYSHSIFYLNTE